MRQGQTVEKRRSVLGEPSVQTSLILLVIPLAGYAFAAATGPYLPNLPRFVSLALSLAWYLAYFVAFLAGLFSFLPIGVVLLVRGLLRYRRQRDASSSGSSLVGWRALAIVCIGGYMLSAWKVVSFQPEHLTYESVRVGQTREEVKRRFGLPSEGSVGPCGSNASEYCQEDVYYGTDSAWGNLSGWRMAVDYREGRVVGRRIVDPKGHRESIGESEFTR